jgi:hypothetical protein
MKNEIPWDRLLFIGSKLSMAVLNYNDNFEIRTDTILI